MNIATSQLKSLARVLANIFNTTTPATLFIDLQDAVFKNYDHFNVIPYDSKNTFGLQSILESFAKSLGFNTYNGLLQAKKETVDLNETALFAINPYPLNSYYTKTWQTLSSQLIKDTMMDLNFSDHLIGSFKNSFNTEKAIKNSLEIQLASILKINDPKSIAKSVDSDSPYIIQDQFKGLSHYFGIVNAMLSCAVNMPLTVDEDTLKKQLIGAKLSDFCSFKAWGEINYSVFKTKLIAAFKAYAYIDLTIEGDDSDPLNNTLNMYFMGWQPNVKSQSYTEERHQLIRLQQEALLQIASRFKDDEFEYGLDPNAVYLDYKGEIIKPHLYLVFNFIDMEDLYANLKISFSTPHELFGSKLYWLNKFQIKANVEESPKSVEEIIALWEDMVLSKLIPVGLKEKPLSKLRLLS